MKLVTYTNSNCSDLWEMYFSQLKKNCPFESVCIADKEVGFVPTFLYDNKEPYHLQWTRALEQIEDEYFIYMQEDFVLFDLVNAQKIEELRESLSKSDLSYIRLIRSGTLDLTSLGNDVYRIGNNSFPLLSMQPTIWKKEDFLKIYKDVANQKWYECREYEEAMVRLGMKGGVYFTGSEPKRGSAHYDSHIFPYVATALVRSKWNTSEYPIVMGEMFKQYGIDKSIRGTI